MQEVVSVVLYQPNQAVISILKVLTIRTRGYGAGVHPVKLGSEPSLISREQAFAPCSVLISTKFCNVMLFLCRGVLVTQPSSPSDRNNITVRTLNTYPSPSS